MPAPARAAHHSRGACAAAHALQPTLAALPSQAASHCGCGGLMHLERACASWSAVGAAAVSTGSTWYRRGQYLPVTKMRLVAGSYAMPAARCRAALT